MSKNAPEEFWSFSLEFYAQPGISDCLIDLQDRFGVDANVVLFCCWCGTSGRAVVDEPLLREAMALTRVWQSDVVQCLRSLRRKMKTGIDGVHLNDSNPVREDIKRLEIECERIEQMRLANLTCGAMEASDAVPIRMALETYLRLLGVEAKREASQSLELLASACENWDE